MGPHESAVRVGSQQIRKHCIMESTVSHQAPSLDSSESSVLRFPPSPRSSHQNAARSHQPADRTDSEDFEKQELKQSAADAIQKLNVLYLHSMASGESPFRTRLRMMRYLSNIPQPRATPTSKRQRTIRRGLSIQSRISISYKPLCYNGVVVTGSVSKSSTNTTPSPWIDVFSEPRYFSRKRNQFGKLSLSKLYTWFSRGFREWLRAGHE
ncbi:hypothetical protein M427DRAFT_224480 [Gonapodya prolifera JEL478]|uniref:Uncharacterized protein n=1 Tax=Gonapodya prolifera (strain JEL478) TaxID=1344416 RepID=A0A139ANA4_GONPJ|nr:hypothetical protein M427DRAFT_224480 [Gonapodya prolifera JEL478]|eukprot:KXS18221.1 hypothetical protein M427DRAFT_224480 [Gonapodya prolifera JEL478]